MTQATTANMNSTKVMINALIAGVIAAVINAILFLVFSSSFEGVIATQMGQEFNIIPVIAVSIIGALGGGVALLGLDRFTGNPVRNWGILAIVVLLFFAPQPFFGLSGANTTAILILEIMHIVVAGLAYYFLIMRD